MELKYRDGSKETIGCEYCGEPLDHISNSFGLDCKNRCSKKKYNALLKLARERKIDKFHAAEIIRQEELLGRKLTEKEEEKIAKQFKSIRSQFGGLLDNIPGL